MINPGYIIIPILFLIPALIASFIFLDKIIRLQYYSYKDEWEKDGRPCGIFWKPKEARLGWIINPKSRIAFQKIALVWLFKTPEWIKSDSDATRLLKKLRLSVAIWNFGIILWALYLLSSFK